MSFQQMSSKTVSLFQLKLNSFFHFISMKYEKKRKGLEQIKIYTSKKKKKKEHLFNVQIMIKQYYQMINLMPKSMSSPELLNILASDF